MRPPTSPVIVVDSDDEDNAIFLSTLKLRCSPHQKPMDRLVPVAESSVADARSQSTQVFEAASYDAVRTPTKGHGAALCRRAELHLAQQLSCSIGATEKLSLFQFGTTVSTPVRRKSAVSSLSNTPQSPKRPRSDEVMPTPAPSGGGEAANHRASQRGSCKRVEPSSCLRMKAPTPLAWILEEASRTLCASDGAFDAQNRVRAYCEANNLQSPLYYGASSPTAFSTPSFSVTRRYQPEDTPPLPTGATEDIMDSRFDVGRLSGTFQASEDFGVFGGGSGVRASSGHNLFAPPPPLPERNLFSDSNIEGGSDTEDGDGGAAAAAASPHSLFLDESARVLSQMFDEDDF